MKSICRNGEAMSEKSIDKETNTVTVRLEYKHSCPIMESIYESMKRRSEDSLKDDNFVASAISTGDLFALENALRHLLNKAERHDLRKVKNWYSWQEVDDEFDEYEDYQEMILDFANRADTHTTNNTYELYKALYPDKKD